ncbi:MAG: hypothetical protein FJX76_06465 [Armatimonadetes bacterium]|nr:hypothetical protein [Armatimonadota bacterium]
MIANVARPTPLATYAWDQDTKNRVMATVPHVALATADAYAAASVTILPPAGAFEVVTPWIGGVAAVAHGIYGASQVFSDSYDRSALMTARGCGHLITAAGFATLAFGLGAYALPIIAIGETTRIAATLVGRER